MSLKKYQQKRDFSKTPEPKPSVRSSKKSKLLTFVIQKHAASHLHYDFRLEMKGVLKSWAVPKGPSLDPAQKRLAMEVEDHPLSYGKFEGIIPKGEYGGGTVMLWDHGVWEPVGDPVKSYQKGRLEFFLHGSKLSGLWYLVRLKKNEQGKTPWLLIKSRDEASRSSKSFDILKKEPKSVVSQRDLDEIAMHVPTQVRSEKLIKTLPKIKPQLATLVDSAPEGDEWLQEVKYDGYRFLAYIQGSSVQLITRNGKDWSEKFPEICKSLKKLKLKNTILDGEIVGIDDNDQMRFQTLVNYLSHDKPANIVYYIFDLPIYSGKDLRKWSLLERKKTLETLLAKAADNIRYSDHIIGNGDKAWKAACKLKLEGIISKKVNSVYESKRTKTWLKLKCAKEAEFVIIGFLSSKKAERPFASLLLGYYERKQLRYAGHVGTGFNQSTLRDMMKQFEKLKQDTSPLKKIPEGINKKQTTWLKPKLLAQIKFTEWTEDGLLRHPVFLGLREDKKVGEVRREMPEKLPPKKGLSHPDKIIFPEKSISKEDLAAYYEAVAPWILPHIINRPLMILRCPEGVGSSCFFQKHFQEDLSQGFYTIQIKEKHSEKPYIYIKNAKGLLSFSQLSVIEIHPWGSNNKFIEQPDRMTFDLDPAEGVKWPHVIRAAERLRDYLLKYNLKSFVKTSGKKGLHVVVPLRPKSGWDVIKEFSRQIAFEMVQDYPNEYLATMSKAKRKGKIFIDYFRNGRGATSVSVYSCRANAQAGVSFPLSWPELKKVKSADEYDINTALKKLKKTKTDPWSGFFTLKQKI